MLAHSWICTTQNTQLHLNIYKYKYLKGCVFLLISQLRKKRKVALLLDTTNEGGPQVH